MTNLRQYTALFFFNTVKILPWIFIGFFAIQYARLGITNEIHLRNGKDLGTYTQILYQINRGQIPPYNSLKQQIAWGDHAHFIMLALAPLFRLWQDPRTIIIIQALAVTISGWAIFKIAQDKIKNLFFSLSLLFSYLLFFGFQYALDFDFHANTLTAAVLAVSFYALHFNKMPLFWLTVALGLLTREDAALFYLMLSVILFFDKKTRKLSIFLSTVSIIYFISVVYLVMPNWTPNGAKLTYFDAGVPLKNPFYLAAWLLSKPVYILKEIFGSDTNINTLRHLAQSYGFLPLFSPHVYILSAPNIVARFLSPEYQRHLLNFHYNASLGSILAFSSILGTSFIIRHLPRLYPKYLSAGILSSLCAVFLLYGTYLSSWKDTDLPLHKLSQPEFTEAKYQPRMSAGALSIVNEMIPKNKSVSAASGLIPQLAARQYIYNFPEPLPKETQWVVLSAEFNTWPLRKGEMEAAIEEFRNNKKYELIWDEYGIAAFKKINK